MSGFPVAAPSILPAATFAGPGEPFFGSGGGEATLNLLTMNGNIVMTSTLVGTDVVSNKIVYLGTTAFITTRLAPAIWIQGGVLTNGQGFNINVPYSLGPTTTFVGTNTLTLFNPGGAVAASIHAANDTVTIEPTICASFAAAAADGTRSSPITLTADHTMVGNKGYFTFSSGSHKITPPLLFPGAECIAAVNYAAGATPGDLVVTYNALDTSITVSLGAAVTPIFYVVFA